ncbi:PREDICTED: uncharacterized protein LOC109584245 isoform X2 [Amphimedon queenslandica]|uniref:Death domain-containing protein n=1 Tax=Amphimedon queenslandica TaxID=400682 RepID=A0AAN0JFD0_AMPQE|nr:PREDICTED: uncharacterized protein LOC109584245 isoform X2 [Amphimedon queenslandica]|eukprot:XP_019855492.1 PREDICTED: uncharacterized protein LOC109584245 isoform X2 [Amphimedon queenslandica]
MACRVNGIEEGGVQVQDVEEQETIPEYTNDEVIASTENLPSCDVTVFGLKLGLTLAEIKVIKAETSDTRLHGFQIYTTWRNKRGVRLTKKDRELLSAFFTGTKHRRSDFTQNRNRPETIAGLTDCAVYPMLESLFDNGQNSNVDAAKLKKFGLALGLESANIDSILNRNKGEYEAVIALAIFTAWKSNIPPNEDNDALKALDDAYQAVMQDGLKQRTKTTPIPPNSTTEKFTTSLPTYLGNTEEEEPLIKLNKSTRRSNKSTNRSNRRSINSNQDIGMDDVNPDPKPSSYKTAACISFIFCLIVAVAIEVSLLTLAFSYKQEETVTILPGDTIRLPLPAYVPPSLDIVLWGQEDTCSAEVLLAKCSNIETREEVLSSLPHIDFNYLVSHSSVTISESVIRPYEIWLFSEEVDADSAVKEQFRGHHCPSATDHEALCALLKVGEKAVTIDVTESSYYFFRCDQFPFNCSQVNTWGINKMVYDFNVPPDDIIDSAIVHVQNISSRIRIRSSYFYSEGSVSDLCLLAQLNTTVCGSDNLIYRMDMTYSSIFHEVLVYATILVGLIMTVLLIACLIWCYRNRCKTTQ